MIPLKVKRGTRQRLDQAALQGQLNRGEPYLITNEGRLAVGTGSTSYEAMAKQEEVLNVSNIGGIPVSIENPQVNDVLYFTGTTIESRAQVELTDGGNF